MFRFLRSLTPLLVLTLILSACQVPEAANVTPAESGPTEITLMRFFGDCFDEFGDNADLEAAYGECGIIQTLTNAFNYAR